MAEKNALYAREKFVCVFDRYSSKQNKDKARDKAGKVVVAWTTVSFEYINQIRHLKTYLR